MTLENAFHTLSFYTLSHPDKEYFIHQHIVDAYTAQTATISSKPISIFFAVIGLYLFIEKHYTGRQVQLMHMQLAKNKTAWPQMILPENRGNITITDVLETKEGSERDKKISDWCKSVWDTYAINRQTLNDFLNQNNIALSH